MAVESEYLAAVRAELWGRQSFGFIPDRDFPPPPSLGRMGGGTRVMFCGFPSDYSLAFLLALIDLDVELVAIMTSPGAHPAIVGDNALSRIAEHLQIPLLRVWRINDLHTRMDIAALQPDAVVMASFDQIVGRATLAIPRLGWMNIHPSLLPEFRGPEPVYWAIADGAKTTGITAHRAIPLVDAGPILTQAKVEINPEDNAGTLTRRLCAVGTAMLGDAVAALLAGTPGTPVDPKRGSYRSSVGHRPLESARSVAEAERWVRAGNPNMLAWGNLQGRRVYVLRARSGTSGISFPDGRLELLETAETCGCHHDASECPHREPWPAPVPAGTISA